MYSSAPAERASEIGRLPTKKWGSRGDAVPCQPALLPHFYMHTCTPFRLSAQVLFPEHISILETSLEGLAHVYT